MVMDLSQYRISKGKDYWEIDILNQGKEGELLSKLENRLSAYRVHPTGSKEYERKQKVWEAVRNHGHFSFHFSKCLTKLYARENDFVVCFFVDFNSLNLDERYKDVFRVNLSAVNAFIEKMGKVALIVARKFIVKKSLEKIEKMMGGFIVAEDKLFHFLLLHEIYHYCYSCYYQDLTEQDLLDSMPVLIQEYKANNWARSELENLLNTEREEARLIDELRRKPGERG